MNNEYLPYFSLSFLSLSLSAYLIIPSGSVKSIECACARRRTRISKFTHATDIKIGNSYQLMWMQVSNSFNWLFHFFQPAIYSVYNNCILFLNRRTFDSFSTVALERKKCRSVFGECSAHPQHASCCQGAHGLASTQTHIWHRSVLYERFSIRKNFPFLHHIWGEKCIKSRCCRVAFLCSMYYVCQTRRMQATTHRSEMRARLL